MKQKSHPVMKLTLVQVFSCEHPLTQGVHWESEIGEFSMNYTEFYS